MKFRESHLAERLCPGTYGIGVLLKLLVDHFRSIFGPTADDRCCEVLLGREMIVDAGTLNAHIGCNFSETEAAQAARLHLQQRP